MPKSKADEEKKELQRKYMQFQLARQYMAALMEQKNAIEAKIAEMAMTVDSMRTLKKVKKSEEMWSTLGSDVFVTSDVKDTSTAIVAIGAGVYAKKPMDEAIKTIEIRHAELTEVERQLVAELESLNKQLAKLEPEIQAMAANMSEEEKE